MNRKPLSNIEMSDALAELLDSIDFKNDRDRAQYLAGMKVGAICIIPFEEEEALRMCKVIFRYQKEYDPRGKTWNIESD